MDVRIENVTKRFGSFTAMKDLNLTVGDGEFLSMVGPSGCGKTTTLRMIAGFLTPDEGEIYFGDRAMSKVPIRNRNVGIVFQNYALFPNMTALENVAFGLQVRKVPISQAQKTAQEYLELVGLADKSGAYPRQMSGGQQQRVALARALAIRPSVLLLDEPLSALDAKVRNALRFEIKRIQRESGITTVYVTHDQEEALSISDRVALMNRGCLAQVGTPLEIYSAPADNFVADFVGVNNLLNVEVLRPGWALWNGQELAVSGEASGQATLAIRPERLVPCQEPEGSHVLTGIVRGRIFLGPIVRVALDVRGVQILVDLISATAEHCRDGETLSVRFEPEHGRLIP